MTVIYVRIFSMIHQNNKQRANLMNHREIQPAAQQSTEPVSLIVRLKATSWVQSVLGTKDSTNLKIAVEKATEDHAPKDANQEGNALRSDSAIPDENSGDANGSRCSSYKKERSGSKKKALFTTLIILGTYLLCWIPSSFFIAFTCVDFCPFPITQWEPVMRVCVSFVSNALICVKALVDPFIYCFRMKEVRLAFRKFFQCGRSAHQAAISLNSSPRTRLESASSKRLTLSPGRSLTGGGSKA